MGNFYLQHDEMVIENNSVKTLNRMNLNSEFEKFSVVWKAKIQERELIERYNSCAGQLNITKSLIKLHLEIILFKTSRKLTYGQLAIEDDKWQFGF